MAENAKLTKHDQEVINQAFLKYLKLSENDFLYFVRLLEIQVGGRTNVFDDVMADFQLETFQQIAPSLLALKNGEKPPCRRVWIERTKKASKDADIGCMVLWLVAFAQKPFFGQLAAVDSGQADIIKDRISHLLHYNPWLNDRVELIQNKIRSKHKKANQHEHMAVVEVIATDAPGAHGAIPDLLVVNELAHIQNWEFVETILTNADGVPDGLVIVATNAGVVGTKSHAMRERVVKDDIWQKHIYSKPAPWHDLTTIQDTLPENQFKRLWLGQWTSGKGDALNEEKIRKCFSLKGPQPYDPKKTYLVGLDLGVKHDHSALVILGIDEKQRMIETAYWQNWKPNPKEVDLQSVQNTVILKAQEYHTQAVFYDPTEAKLLAQQIQHMIPMIEFPFKPANLDRMATSLIQVTEDEILKCYDNSEYLLRRDLGKIQIEQRNYGHRLTATRDETGHADVATAMVIALPAAIDMLRDSRGFSQLQPDDELIYQGELTEEDIENMPADLLDIIQAEEAWSREANPRLAAVDDWDWGDY